MEEKKTVYIYPWKKSSTGDWSVDTGLYMLRDESAEYLVDKLWQYGNKVQQSAMDELIRHGNPRKAAAFVRGLVNAHPDFEEKIKSKYPPMLHNFLFEQPLSDIPSKPEEMGNVIIQYIQ